MRRTERNFIDSAEESIPLLFAGVSHLHGNTTGANKHRSKFKTKAVTSFILLTPPCFSSVLERKTALRRTGKKCTRTERMVSYHRKCLQSSQEKGKQNGTTRGIQETWQWLTKHKSFPASSNIVGCVRQEAFSAVQTTKSTKAFYLPLLPSSK